LTYSCRNQDLAGDPAAADFTEHGTPGDCAQRGGNALYYYPPGSGTVEVLPIGIGQAGRETPRNWVTSVERKQEAPTWTPTANTRREYAKRGESLPAFVPAGPDNPMGLYAIYIGRLYAIHGTNANFGIGLRVSQGCIRLRNDDIKYLFDNVPVGNAGTDY
jgi:L,D-transpeptidase ErfK/SrfK